MPDSYLGEDGKFDKKKKESLLYQRYNDADAEKDFTTEQEKWEENQIIKSLATSSHKKHEDEFDYEYIFDEDQQINFVQEQVAYDIIDSQDGKPQLSESEKKSMTTWIYFHTTLSHRPLISLFFL